MIRDTTRHAHAALIAAIGIGVVILSVIITYVVNTGWRNLDTLFLVAIAGVIAVIVTVGAVMHPSVILAFLVGPAWVAYVYMLVFWNDGNVRPQLLLSFAAIFATIIGGPIGAFMALVQAGRKYFEVKEGSQPSENHKDL